MCLRVCGRRRVVGLVWSVCWGAAWWVGLVVGLGPPWFLRLPGLRGYCMTFCCLAVDGCYFYRTGRAVRDSISMLARERLEGPW